MIQFFFWFLCTRLVHACIRKRASASHLVLMKLSARLRGLLGSSLLSQFPNQVLLNSGAPGRSRRLRGIHDTGFFLVSMHTSCACVYSQACKCLTLGSDKTFGTPVRSAGVLFLKQISKPGAPQLGRSWTLLGAPGRSKALMPLKGSGPSFGEIPGAH